MYYVERIAGYEIGFRFQVRAHVSLAGGRLQTENFLSEGCVCGQTETVNSKLRDDRASTIGRKMCGSVRTVVSPVTYRSDRYAAFEYIVLRIHQHGGRITSVAPAPHSKSILIQMFVYIQQLSVKDLTS